MDTTSSSPDLDKIAPVEPSPEANYVLIGVIVGLVFAFGLIGVIYYKNNRTIALISKNQASAGTSQFQIPFFNRIGTKTITAVPTQVPVVEPTKAVQPTVTPVKVNTMQDLINQQKALDITDMNSVLTDLEKNSKDSLQFSQ